MGQHLMGNGPAFIYQPQPNLQCLIHNSNSYRTYFWASWTSPCGPEQSSTTCTWAGAVHATPMPHLPVSSALAPSEQFYGNKNSSWLLDSGVSRHMTRRLDFLSNIYVFYHCLIELPKGSSTFAYFEGTVKFETTFAIYRVLYIPNPKCNLISISQLLHFNPSM